MYKVPSQIKSIFWDFDGVLMDSMHVRDKGFEIVLKDYSKEEVAALLKFHRENGGLSRYVKFRYFFEIIKKQEITEEEVKVYAQKFSDVMFNNLLDEKLLIEDAIQFVKKNFEQYEMHIVSGSDQTELRHICTQLKLNTYFQSINGSPTPKKQLVKDVLEKYDYKKEEAILIGDSINDFEAADENEISFIGYNNKNLQALNFNYINKFGEV